MFKIESRDLTSAEARLLFNIQELLIKLSSKSEQPKKEHSKEKTYICKTCNTPYPNAGGMLACARKHKKEGVK